MSREVCGRCGEAFGVDGSHVCPDTPVIIKTVDVSEFPNPEKPGMADLRANFDRLTATYRSSIKLLVDALAPDVPQADRDKLRELFAPMVQAQDKGSKGC